MGKGAGVPIEPSERGKLLDATHDITGTVFAGIPGAGGFDAVFVIFLCPSSNYEEEYLARLDRFWTTMGVKRLQFDLPRLCPANTPAHWNRKQGGTTIRTITLEELPATVISHINRLSD